jgi:uncharacterized protein YbaA (DUF1428 family)
MYIDGFVLPVPTTNREAYRAFDADMAIAFKEAWGEDVPEGKVNSMRSAVLLKEDETVVFAWISWPDKATRDAGMKAAFDEPRRPLDMSAMPFDGKRMIFGGFETILSV